MEDIEHQDETRREEEVGHIHKERRGVGRRPADKVWRGATIALALAAVKAYSAYSAQHDELVRSAITRTEDDQKLRSEVQGIKEQVQALKGDNIRIVDRLDKLMEWQARRPEVIYRMYRR